MGVSLKMPINRLHGKMEGNATSLAHDARNLVCARPSYPEYARLVHFDEYSTLVDISLNSSISVINLVFLANYRNQAQLTFVGYFSSRSIVTIPCNSITKLSENPPTTHA